MFRAVSQIDGIQKRAHLGPVVTKDLMKNPVSVAGDLLLGNRVPNFFESQHNASDRV
jgi:hypothetical protein